jgi:hypothetical protein
MLAIETGDTQMAKILTSPPTSSFPQSSTTAASTRSAKLHWTDNRRSPGAGERAIERKSNPSNHKCDARCPERHRLQV